MLWATGSRPDSADDFRQFYRAGSLAGQHESVYSHPALFPDKGKDGVFLPFIRIPSYALVFRPIAKLPYFEARRIWLSLGFLALIGAVWLMPSGRAEMAAAAAWSLPVAYAFVLGQDIFFVVLIVLLAARIASSGKEFLGGLALSLLGIKITYLPAVGLACLAKSRRATLGLITGVSLQLVLSFAMEGFGWPLKYVTLLRNPLFDLEPRRMLNIRAITTAFHLPSAIYLAAALGLYALLWIASKRVRLADALIVALPIGLIASPHCYVYDAVVLIPLFARSLRAEGWAGRFALLGLTPLPYLALMSETPWCLFLGSSLLVTATIVSVVSFSKQEAEHAEPDPLLPAVVFGPPPVLN